MSREKIVKEWQTKLHKAFSAARPRHVRFQFFTDYDIKKIELWREGGTVPKESALEIQPHETWFGFTTIVAGDDLTEEAALEAVKGLFAKFQGKE